MFWPSGLRPNPFKAATSLSSLALFLSSKSSDRVSSEEVRVKRLSNLAASPTGVPLPLAATTSDKEIAP